MNNFDIKGYEKVENKIDIQEASRLGCFIMWPSLLIYGIPFVLIWYSSFSVDFFGQELNWNIHPMLYPVVFLLVFVVGVVLHELIHGLFWAIFAKRGFRSIRFGIMKAHNTPYCHCKEPLRVKHYIVGAIMPLVILGVIPGIISWCTGSWLILCFAIFFTMTAIGDMMIIRLVWKLDPNLYVQDHPTEAGYYTYKKKD